MFVPHNQKIAGFLRMARLLGFLESDASKADKVLEIKAARADGFIDEEEALELTVEFC